ncbi:MAG: MerC domain-containing protein, partial [Bacteroidota bacterium]
MKNGAGQIEKLRYSDFLGVAASGLCAIHCALTPVFFAARPILESTVGHHHHGNGFWSLLDYLFLVLSLAAVWYSARHTRHKGIRKVLWVAWVVFAIPMVISMCHDQGNGAYIHQPFTIFKMKDFG